MKTDIIIPDLYCVYKTRSGFECVCTYKYTGGSSEMTIISAQWWRKPDKFYLDENGNLESNARNSWISGGHPYDNYFNNNHCELVEQLTYRKIKMEFTNG